jgi:hypothetical protein
MALPKTIADGDSENRYFNPNGSGTFHATFFGQIG